MKNTIKTKVGHLYVIDFPNGKAYYGITSRTLRTRVSEHRRLAENGADYAISKAFRLYGDWFIAEILVTAPMWYLNELEPKVIQSFNSRIPYGYNQHLGGAMAPSATEEVRALLRAQKLGTKASDETRAKLRKAWERRPRNQKWSEEERKRRSEKPHVRAMLGRQHTTEARQKIAQASQLRSKRPEVSGELNPMRRPEIAAKVADANRGRKRSPEAIHRMKQAWIQRKLRKPHA